MEMFRTIVCPVDFSDASYAALETAQGLARHFGGELIVIHVVEPIPPVPVDTDGSMRFDVFQYEDELMTSADRLLQETMAERLTDDVKTRLVVVGGVPWEEVVRVAAEENAGLLVIATHGRAGWKHLLFGSVTEKVIRVAPCPVLVIRAPKDSETPPEHDQASG
ncbi:universal stress protein [Candidatus Fermentibacteria bacterium]|nr:universal stress protein [Candidatus Fermentibacteria bacterium]